MTGIIDEYHQFQKKSEVNDNFDIKYMAIGLAGEVGEVLNEIKKIERDDNNIMTNDRKMKLKDELGDVLWYFTGICNRLNYKIDDILKYNKDKINRKKHIYIESNNNVLHEDDVFGNYSQHETSRSCF